MPLPPKENQPSRRLFNKCDESKTLSTKRGFYLGCIFSALLDNSYNIERLSVCNMQKRSTEGCSKFKSPETRQVQERLVSTLEHMQVPKWDRTRCPEE